MISIHSTLRQVFQKAPRRIYTETRHTVPHRLPHSATHPLLRRGLSSKPTSLHFQSPLKNLRTPQLSALEIVGAKRFLSSKTSPRSPQEPEPSSLDSLEPAAKEHGPVAQNEPKQELSKASLTKSALLAQAPTRLSRLWIHIKWPLTRNNQPFSLDDFSAFASWLVMGQVLWIVLGTTTFVLAAMYSIDTLDLFWKSIKGLSDSADNEDDSVDKTHNSTDQSFLGSIASRVLSHGLGAEIVFEKGHVLPRLEDGMLKFRNVKILLSRAAGAASPQSPLDFSAKISGLNLTLSFKKWYDGKGLIYNMEIFGMHAKVTRTVNVTQSQALSEMYTPTFNSLALSFSGYHDSHELQTDLSEHKAVELAKAASSAGFVFLNSDYELSLVKIRDSRIEIHEKAGDNALAISIFNCDLPRLRGDRLLIDFFNANIVTGTVNNSMFTIHKHQTFSNNENIVTFKLDGIDMGSLSTANAKLKFNWLVGGKAEIVADIRLPDFDASGTESRQDAAVTSGMFLKILLELGDLTNPRPSSDETVAGDSSLLKGALMALYETFTSLSEPVASVHGADYVIVNAKVKFTDLQATLPSHLPMASSADVPFITLQNLRSLISYINSLEFDTPLVIKTTVIEKLADLYNIDNISQTKIYDAIIGDIYDELLRMIKLDEKRIIREKSNMWSHSVMSQLLLLGLGVMA